jgi:hypothetical protein
VVGGARRSLGLLMGLLISACSVLCIFFLRDVFLLGSNQEHVFRKLGLYFALMSFYLPAAMRTVYSFPESQALSLLGSPWIWTVTLVMHAGLWWAAVWFKRRPNGRDRMWLIAVVPAPMLILSVIATSHRLSGIMGSSSAFNVGMIASAAWIALVLIGVVAFRTFYSGWEDWGWAADLAAIASWTGIGILPFTGVLQWAEIVLKYD